MSAYATVYLTDGFERVDVPSQVVAFHLIDGWDAVGHATWRYRGKQPITVAGWEVVLHTPEQPRAHYDLEPTVIHPGQPINLECHVRFNSLDQDLSPT